MAAKVKVRVLRTKAWDASHTQVVSDIADLLSLRYDVKMKPQQITVERMGGGELDGFVLDRITRVIMRALNDAGTVVLSSTNNVNGRGIFNFEAR